MTEELITQAIQVRRWPVVEVFGPVFEGEGFFAGVPTHFVRFGNCDFHCSWCDSLYAVEPALVKKNATKMTSRQIVDQIFNHRGNVDLVTFSGGNPALWKLDSLVADLHEMNYKIKVETQGTVWNDYLKFVDHIVMSPKPPSANEWGVDEETGEKVLKNDWNAVIEEKFPSFYANVLGNNVPHSVKIVVYTQTDIEWAYDFCTRMGIKDVYLSCCTQADDDRNSLGDRYATVGDMILRSHFGTDPSITVHYLLQMHVIAYLHARGV